MTENTVGLGVECTICHTVYFIERPTNRDRFYCTSKSPAGWSVLPLCSKPHSYERSVVITKNVWKLLCICSQQVSFDKTKLKWYLASREALKRGRAVQGEWRRADGPLPWTLLEHRAAL